MALQLNQCKNKINKINKFLGFFWQVLFLWLVAVCTVLSYLSIGLGREVEGRLVLAGDECQGV